MTLLFGTAQDARVLELGASGAIAAVLGSYFVLCPGSKVLTFIFPIFLVRIPALIFQGVWFLYQLIEANFGLFDAHPNGAAWRSFAHVGGFIFGPLAARLLAGRDGPRPGGAMALHGVAPATEVRNGLVSGIVNTDMVNQY